MRHLLFSLGFVASLAIAASSFASLTDGEEAAGAKLSQQSFFIPKSGTGIDECLIGHTACGQAAAASLCQSRGFAQVVSFGEAAPEDMTGSVEPARKNAQRKEAPLLVTCAR